MEHPNRYDGNRIISVGTFLPKDSISSQDLFFEIQSEKQYGIPYDWMCEKMGIHARRIAAPDLLPSDLAIPAAREALARSNLQPEDIDLLIFCGIERDRPEPATAHTIQRALGTKANHVFDVANACYGFADGVEIANAFITTNVIRYALIVTGEIPSRVLLSITERLKRGIPRKDYELCSIDGDVIGKVTSGTMSPVLGYGIGMGYVNVPHHKQGTEIYVQIRQKRIKATVVRPPFIAK